jgi:hypothetical protein
MRQLVPGPAELRHACIGQYLSALAH